MQVTVPLIDLKRQHEAVEPELTEAIERVIKRSSFTLGEEVDAFELEFAEFCGVRYGIGVGTGTDALHFALRACDVSTGDEVITAVNSFAATAEAIVMCGARPVFADVDENGLIDVDCIEAAIGPKTKAIVPVHLYGRPAEMGKIRALAWRHGLRVVEDACQAHGASLRDRKVGGLGDAGCFSFYPSKNLGAMGDGGIVVTDDREIAERVRLLRNHGEDDERRHLESGYCSRLHGMQAAILRVKLSRLTEWNASRQAAAEKYTEAFGDLEVVAPPSGNGGSHVYHLYVIRTSARDELSKSLAGQGIASGIHYPHPLHLEPAFRFLGYRPGDFPVAERLAQEILSLPIHPFLKASEIEAVTASVKKWVKGRD